MPDSNDTMQRLCGIELLPCNLSTPGTITPYKYVFFNGVKTISLLPKDASLDGADGLMGTQATLDALVKELSPIRLVK